MKISYLIILILFSSNLCYSQNVSGVYHGSLISDNNLIFIKEKGKYFEIKIFLSEKQSILTDGEFANGLFRFPLPQNEGEDLMISAEIDKTSACLDFEFEIDGIKYSGILNKIQSPKRNLEKTWFKQINTAEYDQRIVGQWIHYITTDSLGNTYKGDFLSSKRYTTSFLKNGVVLYDVQMIRDAFKEFGIKSPVDYTTIPKATWSTTKNNHITMTVGADVSEYRYEISSDSLQLISDIGSILHHVRK